MAFQIYTYQREVFPTFMLAHGVHITLTLNQVNVEVIAKIQCYIYTRKTPLHEK